MKNSLKTPLTVTKQTLLFTLLTILFVIPKVALQGTNIVTHTYAFGTLQLFKQLSPYVDPRGA